MQLKKTQINGNIPCINGLENEYCKKKSITPKLSINEIFTETGKNTEIHIEPKGF